MTKNTTTIPQIGARYAAVREQSLSLCAPLLPEDYTIQPHPDVSPPKWHLGHGSWFFENFILTKYLDDYECFDEQLNWFFNSYYESQGPRIQRSNRGNMSRPDLQTILDYRAAVDVSMQQLLLQAKHESYTEITRLVEIGLQHEQQHQELLAYDIKYILGTNPLFPHYHRDDRKEPTEAPKPLGFKLIKKGKHTIGHKGKDFCWDNELGRHDVLLDDFEIADRLITNGEYLEFMRDGGYERFDLWQSDGIAWVREHDVRAPLYWYETESDWVQYTLSEGLISLDPNLPVTHISWYEADAYARWAGGRLATEVEWEAACIRLKVAVDPAGNWLENGAFHPTTDVKGYQLLGHAWEWTNSAYLPYPRYSRPGGALGEYNGKFMINQMVLRGGSCATPVSHIRSTYRNFFQPEKRWMFTGIRIVRDR